MKWTNTLLIVAFVAAPPAFFVADQYGYSFIERSKAAGMAIVEAIADPLAVFDQRSPGARGEAELRRSKKERALANHRERDAGEPVPTDGLPRERVLANTRERDNILPSGDDLQLPELFPGSEEMLFPAPQAIPSGNVGGGRGPLFVPSVPIGSGGSGGGNPDGPFEPTVPITPEPPVAPERPEPVVAPIPEPMTWIMLILGFFAVGATIRHTQRKFTKHDDRRIKPSC